MPKCGWALRKLCGFIKIKARRCEVSTATSLQINMEFSCPSFMYTRVHSHLFHKNISCIFHRQIHTCVFICAHTHTHSWPFLGLYTNLGILYHVVKVKGKLSRIWCLCWTLCYRPGNSRSCILICLSLGLSRLNNHRTYICAKCSFPETVPSQSRKTKPK